MDLIERQVVIDAVKDADVCVFYSDNQSIDDVLDYTIKATKGSVIASIEQLSSTQPDESDAVYQLWKRAYEAGERSTQPEIVRCKDCKHFGVDRYNKLTWCSRINYGYGYQADDFCSKAERRTDEGD